MNGRILNFTTLLNLILMMTSLLIYCIRYIGFIYIVFYSGNV